MKDASASLSMQIYDVIKYATLWRLLSLGSLNRK